MATPYYVRGKPPERGKIITARQLQDSGLAGNTARGSGWGMATGTRHSGGSAVFVKRIRPGSSKPLPFSVTTRPNPDDPDTFQAKVFLQSNLMKSVILSDRQEITGLDSWFNYDVGNDLIY